MRDTYGKPNDQLVSPDGFDGDWYLEQYPDVAALGMAPLEHYLWIGAQLGRRISPTDHGEARVFSTTAIVAPMPQAIEIVEEGPPSPGHVAAEFIGEGTVPVEATVGVSVGIHAHMYYPDLAAEFAQYLALMPCPFDLYVSVADEEARASVTAHFQQILRIDRLDVRIVPNIGRDIAPFVVEFGRELAKYDVCAHIHSKKSLYNQGATDGWRQYVVGSLFESPGRISFFINCLRKNRYGLIYPQTYYNIPYMAHTWLANSGLARHFAHRFGVSHVPDGYIDFPAGSMFWAKTDAIRPLLEAGLDWADFPPEQGQTDGTLAHCIERMLGVVPTARHFQHGVIGDKQTPSWSMWRFNQFLDRPLQHIHDAIDDPAIKVVAFDIFDTLLTRPFLDADYVKSLLDRKYEKAGFAGFHAARASHEGVARNAKNHDVDIHEIYEALIAATGRDDLLRKEMEIELEIATVRPRGAVVALFDRVRRQGKRVVLASDMFLPRTVIETMLDKCGIGGWDHFYLSCEIGVRKDSSHLYQHILAQENVSPDQILMIGDNERSDFQIPVDMGLRAVHVIKPVNLLRAVPRFADIVPDARHASFGEQFIFGAIAAENFGAISYPEFSADDMFATAQQIGYGLLGPIVLAFCQWLERRVVEDQLDGLQFMAREGKFLKRAFDFWQRNRADPVRTEYLLVSRRAVTVPCIASLEDALDIASANNFYGATMDAFLAERFGVALGDTVWVEVERQNLWQRGRPLEIIDGQIDIIKPFMAAVMPHIMAQAQAEREAALAYFKSSGLGENRHALVDVGYGGTIQRHLVKLLNKKVPGLYLITDEKGREWGVRSGVPIQGCFVDGAVRSPDAASMFVNSFLIEKMLSANDQQVMGYVRGGSVKFRDRPEEGDPGSAKRMEMQDAAMRFLKDAVRAREELGENLKISPALCEVLYKRFSTFLSTKERKIFAEMALDDFYCGRGMVH